MSNSFEVLGLGPALIDGLKKQGITEPMEIQERVIPLALQRKDIIGQSKTGTGKTLAYVLPIFEWVDIEKRELQALILAPTYELVVQIHKEIERLAADSGKAVAAAAIIGEANITRQIERLKEKPQIVVGSTGRILELINKKKLSGHTIKTIVIDEADRLLDKDNIDIVKAVIKTTLRERQLMIFSATISQKTVETAREIMKEPEIVKVEDKDTVNPDITNYYFVCDRRDKFEMLRKLIHAVNPEKAIVFINNSDDILVTTEKLKYHKLKAEGIHGTHEKEERKKALEAFREGRVQLLVASDLAARGLDIKGVTHIFNLEVPENPKDYLHRAGRTGRAGSSGTALSIVTEREEEQINKIARAYKIQIEKKDVFKGKIVDTGNPRKEASQYKNKGRDQGEKGFRPKKID
ncbi:MAG: DEAD/DEAH box helicase [Bacillota bacterium]|nr:DEAD/DEAH box helicase [Bacillota bacterium]